MAGVSRLGERQVDPSLLMPAPARFHFADLHCLTAEQALLVYNSCKLNGLRTVNFGIDLSVSFTADPDRVALITGNKCVGRAQSHVLQSGQWYGAQLT